MSSFESDIYNLKKLKNGNYFRHIYNNNNNNKSKAIPVTGRGGP
jgi:hypothetical protein